MELAALPLTGHAIHFVVPWTSAHHLPYPSPSPRVYPSSCPLNRWYHPTISSSVSLFSFCSLSFLASRSFPVSWLFASGSQSIGASASASVIPKGIKLWFKIDWFDLLAFQGTLKSLLKHHSSKASTLQCSAFFIVQNLIQEHYYMFGWHCNSITCLALF